MTSAQLSFEFFPPKNDVQRRRFWRTYGALEAFAPRCVSMTWGALGANKAASLDILEPLTADTQVPVVAHLTGAGMSEQDATKTLDRLADLGITRILALRGDGARAGGAFAHASDLVEFLARRGGFDISVAAYPDVHPEAASAHADLDWLAHKAQHGASQAITQFFFDTERFLRWRDQLQARGIDIEIVPGILPVHDIDRVLDFARSCGAAVPDALTERFKSVASTQDRQALAIEVAAEQCQALQCEGLNAFHIYTLNRAVLASGLADALGVERQSCYQAA